MSPGDGGQPLDIAMPARPPTLPAGPVAYSPSTGMWRTRDGVLFDRNGNPVAQ
jgi:hypothetical protein